MLALAPGVVRLDAAEPGDARPIAQIMPVLRERGVRAVSGNGILGDPAGASAAEGERLLAELTQGLADAIAGLWSSSPANCKAAGLPMGVAGVLAHGVQVVPGGVAVRGGAVGEGAEHVRRHLLDEAGLVPEMPCGRSPKIASSRRTPRVPAPARWRRVARTNAPRRLTPG